MSSEILTNAKISQKYRFDLENWANNIFEDSMTAEYARKRVVLYVVECEWSKVHNKCKVWNINNEKQNNKDSLNDTRKQLKKTSSYTQIL